LTTNVITSVGTLLLSVGELQLNSCFSFLLTYDAVRGALVTLTPLPPQASITDSYRILISVRKVVV